MYRILNAGHLICCISDKYFCDVDSSICCIELVESHEILCLYYWWTKIFLFNIYSHHIWEVDARAREDSSKLILGHDILLIMWLRCWERKWIDHRMMSVFVCGYWRGCSIMKSRKCSGLSWARLGTNESSLSTKVRYLWKSWKRCSTTLEHFGCWTERDSRTRKPQRF